MDIKMAIDFSALLRTNTRKSDGKPINAATAMDRPKAPNGFAHVLKGTAAHDLDPCVKAFQGNNAYTTRLGGLKLW